jgi:hypothetical protein
VRRWVGGDPNDDGTPSWFGVPIPNPYPPTHLLTYALRD